MHVYVDFSEGSVQKGFTVIIDNRQGYWKDPKTLFSCIHVRINSLTKTTTLTMLPLMSQSSINF